MASDQPPSAKKAKLMSNALFSHHGVALVLDYGSQYTQVSAGGERCSSIGHRAAGHASDCDVQPITRRVRVQLIARRVRENGVLSILLPGDVSLVRWREA